VRLTRSAKKHNILFNATSQQTIKAPKKILPICHIYLVFHYLCDNLKKKTIKNMYEYLQNIKQRYGIIGNNNKLNRALDKAVRVAPTDITVLVSGESGVGKEVIPKIIHQNSHRKHGAYFAVNCGAIPEGTIDSELFGHEKGAFTGATSTRKGYFEVADGGTLFLDEIGELPLTTQVRLLRVLENGEFIKVGSSKVQKTDVRIVAATNKNLIEMIDKNKFREDLFYRLNTVDIKLPPLRERSNDIHLLFRKFASDFAQKYGMPAIRLTPDAVSVLESYDWPGNIRQLRNITEQISILEEQRSIDGYTLQKYLPDYKAYLPSVVRSEQANFDYNKDREMLYKLIFDLKKEIDEVKQKMAHSNQVFLPQKTVAQDRYFDRKDSDDVEIIYPDNNYQEKSVHIPDNTNYIDISEDQEESLSLQDKEKDLIKKALEKYHGKRRKAAEELGISERTLYRKIKQYDL
jgi:transcriptional regulator with PAS, ATPase and Fis domain